MITEIEFKEWLEHPVTKAHKALLGAKRQALKDSWEAGVFTGETAEETGAKSLAAMSESKAYALVNEINFEDFLTEAEGEKGGE